MITMIIVIMLLLALGALAISLLSFGIWLIPVVIIGMVVAKLVKALADKKKAQQVPDVVIMPRSYFEANYTLKQPVEGQQQTPQQ